MASESEDIPDADTQLAAFCQLSPDPDNVDTFYYSYAVCKLWYKTWLKHIGRAEGKLPGQTIQPGPLEMNVHSDSLNEYVPGHIWRQLIEWYGIAPTHELDRRFLDKGKEGKHPSTHKLKEFEICVLSSYMDKLKHRRKVLDMSEYIGYVECQIRKIFRVKPYQKTRLWITEGSQPVYGNLEPMLDRSAELEYAHGIDPDTMYVIVLEVANPDGSWPAGLPDNPEGYLSAFYDVTQTSRGALVIENISGDESNALRERFSDEIIESGDKYISELKLAGQTQAKELDQMREKLEVLIRNNQSFQNELNLRSQQLEMERIELKNKSEAFKTECESFRETKTKFYEEMEFIEQLNAITNQKVSLNVGGHVFVTTIHTLRKDPDSMLATMFNGRHKLQQTDEGEYFIDRDGTYFQYILNYLRRDSLNLADLPDEESVWSQLLAEADYYQINGLCDYLNKLLNGVKVNYRILEEVSPVFGHLFNCGSFTLDGY